VPCSVPTIAGSPSSRLTIAAWQVRPPRLVMIAEAFFMAGSQSGSVLSATRISPSLNSRRNSTLRDNPHRTARDAFPDAPAGDEHGTPRSLSRKVCTTSRFLPACTVSGRAWTMNNLARVAVTSPFDVHRHVMPTLRGIVILDHAAPARQFKNGVVIQGKAGAVTRRHRHVLDHPAAACVVDQLEFLGTDPLLEDGAEALLQRWFEYGILIRIDGAEHDVFPNPSGRIDEHRIGKPGLGVDREHDARRPQIRAHHPLHTDG